jgi:Ca2+-binding RTX toxin-like protein
MATINLGSGNDVRSGTGFADSINGNGGNDTLHGLAGNDLIYGGTGNDLLHGDAGSDHLYGQDGNDYLYGGAGSDWLNGGSGRDTASYAGETGPVTVDMISNLVKTSTGTDTLVSIERVHGSTGNDTMFGYDDSDPFDTRETNAAVDLCGLAGNDKVYGGAGSDHLEGNDGNDTLFGYYGNDRLLGGAGNDSVDGGDNSDMLIGGSGADKFGYHLLAYEYDTPMYVDGGKDTIKDFVHGQDKLSVTALSDNPDSGFLYVSPADAFKHLDSNHDGKLTGADQWVDQKSVTVDGSTKASLVMDIGSSVGEHEFGAAGHDTLTLHGVTSLVASDFALA